MLDPIHAPGHAAFHLAEARDLLTQGSLEERAAAHVVAARRAAPNDPALRAVADRVVHALYIVARRHLRFNKIDDAIHCLALAYAVKPEIGALDDMLVLLAPYDARAAATEIAELVLSLAPPESPEAARARRHLDATL